MIKKILYYTISTVLGCSLGFFLAKYLHDEHFASANICIISFMIISSLFITAGHFMAMKVEIPKHEEELAIEAQTENVPKLNGIWGWLTPGEGPLKSGYPLKKDRILIGRDVKCEIMINEDSVSREHAEILKTEIGYLIRDIASKNGLFVNNQRTKEQYLNNGDTINIGSKSLKLKVLEEISIPVIDKELIMTEEVLDTMVYKPEEENEQQEYKE